MRPVALIVDDSMVVRAFLRKQLSSEDYELVEADSGEVALELSRQRRPDVVLLDVEMPGMSGYEVLTAMQADPALSSVPVIFLSGRVSAADVATGLRMGAHDYLRKPVETGELLARVGKAVEVSRARAESRPPDVVEIPMVPAPPAAPAAPETPSVDALTGVLDYHGLEAKVQALAAAEAGRRLAAVIVDVVGLAHLNEHHGHAVGDQVLRAVAAVMREGCGPRDVLGRVAADEFLVLLPDSGLTEAEVLASAFRGAVERSSALGAGPYAVDVAVAVAASTTDDLEGLFKSLEFKLALDKTARAALAGKSPPPAPAPPPPPPAPLPSWIESTRAPASGAPAPPAGAPAPEPKHEEQQAGRFRRWIRPK